MPAATKTTTVAKTASAAGPTKPTYSVMVTETLKSLGNRNANSVYVISKELAQKYNIDINKHALSKAIKKGVESGDLIQVKASYKLNKTAAAPAKKPSKAATDQKKVAPAKTAKKPSTKSSVKKSSKTTKVSKKVRRFSFFLSFSLNFHLFVWHIVQVLWCPALADYPQKFWTPPNLQWPTQILPFLIN